MNEAPLLWDHMGGILLAMAISGGFGVACGLFIGYGWGSTRTSGETCAIQDLCERYNSLEAECERLREEVKHGLSID